ncbi:hypothetical protein [Stenotrophomonas acidaminiphila]
MLIIANPFNHAGLRDLLMIEWGVRGRDFAIKINNLENRLKIVN